jgi:predicted dehydrogenase
MSRRWNSDPGIAGGGVLIDNGTHTVDIVRYFLGPIDAVEASEGKRIQGLPVEDTARLFVRTVSGALASIDLSWSLNKQLESYIDIYGSNGVIRVGWRESKYRSGSSPDWIVFGSGYDKVRAFRRQVENFCRAVRGEEALLITAEDAMASVQVIEAAYRSARRDHWVAVAAGSPRAEEARRAPTSA